MYSDWTLGSAFDSASMKPVTSSSSPVGSSMTRISNTLTQPAMYSASEPWARSPAAAYSASILSASSR